MGKKEQTIQTILDTSIRIVASNGLENFSAKKVAVSIGISEGTIFHYFPTKRDLLVQCLYYIDAQIDNVLKTVPFSGLNIDKHIHDMWFTYFRYLTSHGSQAKFYRQFRISSFYDDNAIEGQDASFSFFSTLLQKYMSHIGIDSDIFWVFIIETTLNFAIRIVDGQIANTPKNVENMYRLIFNGISSVYPHERIE